MTATMNMDPERLEALARLAMRMAILRHREAGVPMAVTDQHGTREVDPYEVSLPAVPAIQIGPIAAEDASPRDAHRQPYR
jgi:hypothetical protein